MDRRARVLATGWVLVALIAPVVLDRDGFLLSTYPMYSSARGAEVSLVTAQSVTDDGSMTTLSLGVIGESDDPLVVAGELREAIADGRADERCVEIARRAAAWSSFPAGAVSIEVVTERHDVVARTLGERSLVSRRVHAVCEVPT